MILYHGSNVEVRKPKIIVSNRNLDFGFGFYATSSEKQAINWSKRQRLRMGDGKPTVTIYIWNEEKVKSLRVLSFDKANADWLNYVSQNRKGIYKGKLYDIVIGPVANDRTILVINDYIDGNTDMETALLRLKPQVLENQYAFLTADALKTLDFMEVKYYE